MIVTNQFYKIECHALLKNKSLLKTVVLIGF